MKKKQYAWVPKDRNGIFYIVYMHKTKQDVIEDLHVSYDEFPSEWKHDGITVVRVELREVNR